MDTLWLVSQSIIKIYCFIDFQNHICLERFSEKSKGHLQILGFAMALNCKTEWKTKIFLTVPGQKE